MDVVAAHLEAAAAARTARLGEQVSEEIVGAGAAEIEVLAPVRRGMELLAGMVATPERVVGGALFGVAQHVVGFVDLFGLRVRVLVLADIGVVLAHHFPVRLLDVVRARAPVDAKGRVVILVFHSVLPDGWI